MWLVLCIYFEACGEPFEGKVMVGHSIMNRVERRDASVQDIVRQPWQYSWMNPGAARAKLNDFDALAECMKAAYQCLAERIDGKNGFGVDHYFGDYISPPKWASKMTFIRKIGKHLFFRDN